MSAVPDRQKSMICSGAKAVALSYAEKSSNVYRIIPFKGTKIAYAPGVRDFLIEGGLNDLWGLGTMSMNSFSHSMTMLRHNVGIMMSHQSMDEGTISAIDSKLSGMPLDWVFIMLLYCFNEDVLMDPVNYFDSPTTALKTLCKSLVSRAPVHGYLSINSDNTKIFIDRLPEFGIQKSISGELAHFYNWLKKNKTTIFKSTANEFFTPDNLNIKVVNYESLSQLKNAEVWFSGKCIVKKIK